MPSYGICIVSRRLTGVVAGIVALSGATAFAVDVPLSSRFGDVPGTPGTGLAASVWHSAVNSVTGADGVIAATPPPNATFLATYIDYPNGGGDTVGAGNVTDFIGVDAATYVGTDDDQFGEIYQFTGYIAIAGAGSYTFGVGSDDGFRLRIGGVNVTLNDGDRGFGFSVGSATFEAGGLYPIELLYYSNSVGQSGVEFCSSIAGGPDSGVPGGSGLSGITPFQVLYPVPEPASLALLVLAAAVSRRR